jgi:hypothetical protein
MMRRTGKHIGIAIAALLAAICSASAQTEIQGCTKQERNNKPLAKSSGKVAELSARQTSIRE